MQAAQTEAMIIQPVDDRVRVIVDGVTIADSAGAVLLNERGRRPVFYIPIADVVAGALVATPRSSHCSIKGEANYYSLQLPGGRLIENAVWQYATPLRGAEELATRVAFYPHALDRIAVGDED